MMAIKFTSDFEKKFKNPNAVRTAFGNIGYGTLTNIKYKTPVKTGDLRRSESYEVSNENIAWGAGMDYAQIVEDREYYLQEGLMSSEEGIMFQLKKAFEENIK